MNVIPLKHFIINIIYVCIYIFKKNQYKAFLYRMRHRFVLFPSQHCPLQDYALKNPPAVQIVPADLKQETNKTKPWIKKTKRCCFFVMFLLFVHMNEMSNESCQHNDRGVFQRHLKTLWKLLIMMAEDWGAAQQYLSVTPQPATGLESALAFSFWARSERVITRIACREKKSKRIYSHPPTLLGPTANHRQQLDAFRHVDVMKTV